MKKDDDMVQLFKIDVKNTFKCLEEEWPVLSTQQWSENKLMEEIESGARALDTVRIPGGNLRTHIEPLSAYDWVRLRQRQS